MTSQKINDNSASTCEAINQIKIGLRDLEAGFVSKAFLPGKVSPAKAEILRKAGQQILAPLVYIWRWSLAFSQIWRKSRDK